MFFVVQYRRRMTPHLNTKGVYLSGSALDGAEGRYPTIHIQLYADSMKEVEFFLLNHNIAYETRDRKSRTKDPMQDKKIIPVLTLEGSIGPIELLIYHTDDLKINKLKASIEETERLVTKNYFFINTACPVSRIA